MSKFNYKFSTLCGCVYRKGNLLFSNDGDSVYSPVGNRITQFDLRNNKATTFPFESRKNINHFAISPNGVLMITVDEDGRSLLINLHRATVLHHFNFKGAVHDIVFSPDGRLFAVTHGKKVQLWRTPGTSKDFAPFALFREFPGQYDDAMCIGWSADSRFFVVGSRDASCRVFSVGHIRGFHYMTLTGHRSPIVACFFESKSLNFCSVSKDAAIVWTCSRTPGDVAEYLRKAPKEPKGGVASVGKGRGDPRQEEGGGEVVDGSEESEEEEREENEDSEEEGDGMEGCGDVEVPPVASQKKGKGRSHSGVGSLLSVRSSSSDASSEKEEESDLEMLLPSEKKRRVNWCTWYKCKKHVFNREYSEVSCAATHDKESHLLIVGFSSGVFCLYELPDFNLIHTLSISHQVINSVAVSPTGEWLAFGCSSMGQLLVWEWQSESYVLRQQGHYYHMTCLAYSPGGNVVATGGEDGMVKLWNTQSSFCYITFAEHSASVTGVVFGKPSVVVSCSLDGTVRCFDLHRYRNFRTFTSPRPVQFSCVAVDPSGEVICAGSQDTFEIFTWSLQTGRLLEILSGHEGPVSGLAFSPVRATLASCSWDGTLHLWSVFDERGGSDTVQLSADALTLAWSPEGGSLAVATLDGAVVLWDAPTLTQLGSIEGRQDLRPGRRADDKVTAKQLESSGYFTSLCYSADGACLLAGGRSKNVCIYDVQHLVLLKSFQISSNQSFDGMKRFLNSAHYTEAGPYQLISDDETDDRMKLPGALKGEYSKRATKPEILVRHLRFSPTGQAWAAVSTEGLLVYTLDSGIVFDPLDLTIDVTPEVVIGAIKSHDLLTAIILSFKLSDRKLLQKSVEAVAPSDVRVMAANLPRVYLEPMVQFLACALEDALHVEFYLCWCSELLTSHGSFIKDHAGSLSVALTALQKAVTVKRLELGKIAEGNTSLLAFLQTATKIGTYCNKSLLQ